ncbi:MAG: putative toxin-antitoxin system toxin component, PIN family [Bacteroidetes bacterium]|nr:putative toxin-antitoxin system toxin component, PIN family [Bacteroidota bacterium]
MGNRTVLDTNIWVDFIISNRLLELTDLMENNEVVYLRSTPSINEFKRVLAYDKFQKYGVNQKKMTQLYTAIAEHIETQAIFKDCPDKKDNFLFDLAIQGNAKYLVSRDKKVLSTPTPGTKIKKMKFPEFKEDIQ